ncbi:hypothetical protein [Sphingosinicella sp. BN140058]|uniref:hypothetical protein n=1 Tax=Sphingosinicella sp. BN140058 TaxID=1892855 RepID=UPI001010A0E4|nr:hypothetical protein [Sphingosinicella sp. BN140058]QAY79034.1 hypothetical protein ETR14_22710 [Sphingosinicella sp. BN140058]
MTDERSKDDLDQSITEEIGGVQGGGDDAGPEEQVAQSASIGTVPDAPVPDSAEIEWAGGVVKKPPTPNN